MKRALNTCGILGPVVLVALLAAGCAAKTHKALVTFDATALAAVQTIAAVESSSSAAGKLTASQSLSIRQRLRPILALGESSTTALIAWQPGSPIPPDLLTLSAAMGALLRDVVAMLPNDAAVKGSLLTAIALAQAAWADIMRKIVGGQT